MIPLLVTLGAACGAAARYVCGHLWDGAFPKGTLLVNVVGSFVLGVLSGAGVGTTAWSLLGVGFCGGLTTYSAFAVRTVDIARQSRMRSLVYGALTMVLALGACLAGFGLAHP